jgi:hypothetical protein
MNETAKDVVFALCLLTVLLCIPFWREAIKEAYQKTAAKYGKINALGGCLGGIGFAIFFNWLLIRVLRLLVRDALRWFLQ